MRRAVIIAAVVLAFGFGAQRWMRGTGAMAALEPAIHRGSTVSEGADYPLHSKQFDQFVSDSYGEPAAKDVGDFYQWLDQAYQASPTRPAGQDDLTLEQVLDAKQKALAALSDPAEHSRSEIETAAWIHRTIKKVIPRFSLDRGFEFCNIVRCGERQCFLQSVLMTGLLQSMKMNAGVVMVYRNPKGQESNNGHAVTLLKLANGTDIIVDASEPEPFARHEGLYVAAPAPHYVEPAYADGETPTVAEYRESGTGKTIAAAGVKALDVHFVRSQFDYYRGERAVGGIVSAKPTPEGLDESGRYLRASVESCPTNPLAVFTLGRVYLKQGKMPQARETFRDALRLYTAAGWCPASVRDFLTRAGG